MDDDPNNSNSSSAMPLLRQQAFSVVSWNVNSVKARLPLLLMYLKQYSPDIVLLQEIKTETDSFPFLEISDAGYHALVKGQKSYNGVAILSKTPLEQIHDFLPEAPDKGEQSRFIEGRSKQGTRFISVYVPNGEPPATEPGSIHKLQYKISWLDALNRYVDSLCRQDDSFVIGGDFNVIETDDDVYNPRLFAGTAFIVPPVREQFRSLHFKGLTNALRVRSMRSPLYSYWDYQAGAWQKNNGILLDHLFLSAGLADKLDKADVDSDFRGKEKASDHAPVWCSLCII